MSRRSLAVVAAVAAVVGIASGVALAAFRAPRATPLRLPELHGQVSWRAGARPAPTAGLPSLRGHTTVVTFMDPLCKLSCPVEGRQLAFILGRLPRGQRPQLVLVSVNPQARARDAAAASRRWQLARFRTRWVLGSSAALRRVWSEYHVFVKPVRGDIVHTLVLYLVDRRADERTAYLFPFSPAFVQGDLARLAREGA
jgi:cytochrome oxidase Cu insertion factor (SCO1/SenC/PrrC family)